MISMIYVGGVQYHDFIHTPVFLNQIFTLNPKIITIFAHFHYWLGSGMILIFSIISIIQHNSSIISVLLKLFKCCKRQPTIIFVVLCNYNVIWMNCVRSWIFDFSDIIFSPTIERNSAEKTVITVKIALKLELRILSPYLPRNYLEGSSFPNNQILLQKSKMIITPDPFGEKCPKEVQLAMAILHLVAKFQPRAANIEGSSGD